MSNYLYRTKGKSVIGKLEKLAKTLEAMEIDSSIDVRVLTFKVAGNYDRNLSIPPFGVLALKWWDIANNTRAEWEKSLMLDIDINEIAESELGVFESSDEANSLRSQVAHQFREFKRLVELAREFDRLKFFPNKFTLEELEAASRNEKEYSEILLMSIDLTEEEFVENIHRMSSSESERVSFNGALSDVWNLAQTLSIKRDSVSSNLKNISEEAYINFSKNTSTAWGIYNTIKSMGRQGLV